MPLPDRVSVMTCIGCGAMGRQARCEGACSEHKLVLVLGVDHDAMLTAAHRARARAEALAPVARAFVEADAEPADAEQALAALRARAREVLREVGREESSTDWSAPDTVTGWWCAECGNVDLPQPCIGVCVWRPTAWVNVDLYDRQLVLAEPGFRADRSLGRFVGRVAAVRPRADQAQRTWEAFRAQARAALDAHDPDGPAPEQPPEAEADGARDDVSGAGALPEGAADVVRVHCWAPAPRVGA